jgi:hypothetical protein
MLHPITSERVMHRLLDYAASETLVESLSTMYEVGRFRCLDVRRGLDSNGQLPPESGKEIDEGRYPLSGLARALSRNYGAANERLLRGYLQLAFPENASVCLKLLEEPLLTESMVAYACDDTRIERNADSYLGKVSAELFRAEHLIRTNLGMEPLAALPSGDCLAALFGPSR